MRECMNEILELINSKTKCIWVNTYEEEEFIKDMKNVSAHLRIPMPIYTNSVALGTKDLGFGDNKEILDRSLGTDKLLSLIYKVTRDEQLYDEDDLEEMSEDGKILIEEKNNIFILKDFHIINENGVTKRMLRDVIEGKHKNYNCVIITSPITEIPIEHEKMFTVVNYDTPSESDIRIVTDSAIAMFQRNPKYIPISDEDKELVIKACKGLTMDEIGHILRLSMTRHKTISKEEVSNYKIELIKKSNVLEYKIPNSSLDDIGGNVAFKTWINEVMESLTPEAAEFGCIKPKGYLALGVPGSAKTLLAESLATSMSVPFIKLDMSKILDSKVGSSEKNMAQAIRMIKSTAPCLLLVDEVEKTLSGMGSSNNSDGGTMARAVGSVLEFLAEDHGVFVVMTSNDVTQLPPELTRAGRLDAIWYFGLPEKDERQEIFKIHFNKLNKEVDSNLLQYASEQSEQFTGAEIKEAVKNTLRKAFFRSRTDNNIEITKADILKGCSEVIPIAKSSREKIAILNEFATNRARFSNKVINEYGCNTKKNDEIRSILSIDDLRK